MLKKNKNGKDLHGGPYDGTSLDGVDVSIIQSDGNREYLPILDRYFQYEDRLFERIEKLRVKFLFQRT